jgi:hypothetical protein
MSTVNVVNGTIEVYTVEAAGGAAATPYPHSEFSEVAYIEARDYAREHGLRVIVNEFTFSDSHMLDDFTGEGGDG